MRRAPVLALLAASALLAGCTDPSPTAEQTAASESPSVAATSVATTEPTADATTLAESEPVFGTPTNAGGGASICLDDGEEHEVTLSTVLTAITPITIDLVTLTPESPDIEILDQYLLPYDGGLGGLTFGDYPPDDRDGERVDAVGHELGASETVTIGVGLSIAEDAAPVAMTLGIMYKAEGSGDTATLESGYRFVIAEDCEA